MFYKRISDLHPLGIPSPGWDNLSPIPIQNPGKVITSVSSTVTTEITNFTGTTMPWQSANRRWPLNSTSFPSALWNVLESDTYTYTSVSTEYVPEDPSSITSEYYNKALWFEVAVAKDKDGVPTSDRSRIDKYHSKRLNAHLLFTHIDELCATYANITCLDATNITSTKISTNVLSAIDIHTDNITAKYGDITVVHSNEISCQEISVDNGVVKNISGDSIDYLSGTIIELSCTNIRTTNITATGVAQLTAAAAYWADLAELYESDGEYDFGTLVKFGGEKEITIATDKANAIVSEKPAIVMNKGLDRDDTKISLPIVLVGRSKVRVLQPIKKFEKICLSTVPGVAVGERIDDKFKASKTPLGIALESSDKQEEKMVECILQLSLE